MPFEFLISALVTLLVVVEPIGLVPNFLALTEGWTTAMRRRTAWRAALIAVCILAGAALVGEWLLRKLAIGLPAFRIAGGLLLFSIASEMVFGLRMRRQTQTAEKAAEEHTGDIAAFPLAIPLIAGPGAITATVLLAGRAGGDLVMLGSLIGIVIVVGLLCLIAFLAAEPVGKLMGRTAHVVMSRLLGVLLAAMAVQFVLDGLRAAFAQ
jgi:multiple antibiotic resistance protein